MFTSRSVPFRSVPLRTAALCACLLSPVLLVGCGGGSSSTSATATNGSVTSATRTYNNLQFTLSTTQTTFFRGEQVPLTFTMKNTSSQPINAIGGGCNVLLRVLQGSQVVGPEPSGCGASGYTLTLAAGESKTYTLMWSQKDVNSNQVAAGTYTLRAWSTVGNINGLSLTADESEANLSASVQIAVSP